MITHLNEMNGVMEEFFPEPRVADTFSGNIVDKVGYHDMWLT
ncbi:hypothetical protein [Prochlorococcus marinus]|nr:hypothetical protein [Prochlorococcus marinus]